MGFASLGYAYYFVRVLSRGGTKCFQADAHSHIFIFLINTLEYLQGCYLTSCIVQINMAWRFKVQSCVWVFFGTKNSSYIIK